jgi:fluoroquinolone resistance protein
MSRGSYVDDQRFEAVDFRESPLAIGEYDRCTFLNCIFSEADLSDRSFGECTFENCDFSMAKIRNTTFRDAQFVNCKLLGLRFDECNPFLLSFAFDGCILNFSSFFRLKLKKTVFRACKLQEVEFAETDLGQSVFADCDLSGAVFDRTVLEGADLRTAHNFSINPETNKLAKAQFALEGLPGLLGKYKLRIS